MEYVLTFGTTSHSIKAEQTLMNDGITVSVMPLPSAIRAGCGLCMRIGPDALPEARASLDRAGVPVESIYARERSGSDITYTLYTEGECI